MKLILNNRIIYAPIDMILDDIRKETHIPYCKDRVKHGGSLFVTCPFHKNGNELKPSCSICDSQDEDVPFGTYHCWSCGKSGSLAELVGECFHTNKEFGINGYMLYTCVCPVSESCPALCDPME